MENTIAEQRTLMAAAVEETKWAPNAESVGVSRRTLDAMARYLENSDA
jgi:hypothetical protein